MRRYNSKRPPEIARKLSLLGDAVYQLAVIYWCIDHELDAPIKGYAFGLLVSEAFQVFIVEKLKLDVTSASFRGISQKYEAVIGLKAEEVSLQKALNLVTAHLNTILKKSTGYIDLFIANIESNDVFSEYWKYESIDLGRIRATNDKYNLSGMGSSANSARTAALIGYFLDTKVHKMPELTNLQPNADDVERGGHNTNRHLVSSLQKLAVVMWLFDEEVNWATMHMARKILDSRDFRGWFVHKLNAEKVFGAPFESEYAYSDFILGIHSSKGFEGALDVLKKHLNRLKKNRNLMYFFLRYEFFVAEEGWEYQELTPDEFQATLGNLCGLGKTPLNAKMNALFDYYLG